MITVRRFTVIPVLILLVCAAAVLAELLICPKCGYENPEGSEVCTHCEARLPTSAGGDEDSDEDLEDADSDDADQHEGFAARDGEPHFLDPEIVKEEVRVGARHYNKGDVEVAQMFFKNAAALDLLTDPKIKSEWAESIMDLRRKTENLTGAAYRECPLCEGTGKASKRKVVSKVCRRCGGTGRVLATAKLSDRKFRIGRAVRRYRTLQQARKCVSVGEAWVPGDIEPELTVRQRARLKRATAMPCPECMGSGLVACKRCDGTGYVKCGKCENGLVEVKLGGEMEGMEPVIVKRPCPVCGGTAAVRCDTCKGKAVGLCPKCEGTGDREDCRKCGGEGFAECPKCDGTGTYRNAVCRKCKGEGYIECSSCHGDGKKE